MERNKTTESTAAVSHQPSASGPTIVEPEELDARGLQCPGPLMAVADRMATLPCRARLQVLVTDPGFPKDVAAWCQSQGHQLLDTTSTGDHYTALIEARSGETAGEETSAGDVTRRVEKGQTIVVFSGDLDRVLAAL